MPSYQEICTINNIYSKNTAYSVVKKLKALGKIETDTSGRILPVSSTAKKNSVPRNSVSALKLLGLVEAGFPTPSEESLHDSISLDDWIIEKKESSFMLKVKGDSMRDAGILDGDMVIVERNTQPKVGQIVIAEIDGSYTMKYLRKDAQGVLFLEPANDSFENIYPKDTLSISAVVKAVVRKY
jgi:repressor LexA